MVKAFGHLEFAARIAICLGMAWVLPAHGDLFGPPDPGCAAGTSPGRIDVNGDGPDATDPVFYLDEDPDDTFEVVTPWDSCNSAASRTFTGLSSKDGSILEGFERTRPDKGTDIIQLVISAGVAEGADLTEHDGDPFFVRLFANAKGEFDKVGVGDSKPSASLDLLGFDTDGDGVDDFVSVPLAGLGVPPCAGATENTPVWIPVEPATPGGTDVRIALDNDCDGTPDPDWYSSPTLAPIQVPVELQSFSIASRALENPRRVALPVLMIGGLFFGLGKLRDRRSDPEA